MIYQKDFKNRQRSKNIKMLDRTLTTKSFLAKKNKINISFFFFFLCYSINRIVLALLGSNSRFLIVIFYSMLFIYSLSQNLGVSKEFIKCRLDKFSMGFKLLYLNLSNCKNRKMIMKYMGIVLKSSIYLFN